MEQYKYKQAAIFDNAADAQFLYQRIKRDEHSDTLVFLLSPADIGNSDRILEPEGDQIASSIVKKAFLGGAGGGATGAAASLVAGALKLVIFASHPVLASLVAIGYGSALGATGGALIGENLKEDMFLGILEDALKQGHWVVIGHATTRDKAENIKTLMNEVPNNRRTVTN